LSISISKITNETYKILLLLDEQDCMPNHGEISIQIYKKLIKMELSEKKFVGIFLLDLKIHE